jgi:anaerobic selenocysteine-containing dehydrogenase
MTITRRTFMRAAGGGAAAGLAGCKALERGYPEEYWIEQPTLPGQEKAPPGEERFLRSVCMQCEGGCGIVVRVVEGRAVRIAGNRDYPTNQGGLCPKGVNGLQVLYDPDRIRGPLRRDGERGSGAWKPVSWDEAIAEVAARLRTLRRRGQPQGLAVMGGRYRGHMRDLVRRFLTAYGSPNEIDHDSLCSNGDAAAHGLTQGVRDRLAYDWERTRYVLVFGAGFTESFRPTAMMLRVHGVLRGRPGQRAKIVQIDPRFGVSAARADEWVPVRPGADAALALGIAHVLVRDGLHDRDFVARHTLGFEAWTDAAGHRHAGFKDLLLERYAPGRAAELCGVPAATIERLAREAAAHRPAVAVGGRGAAAHTNGLYARLAIHSLNALLGSIEAPGGVLVQRPPPYAAWPAPEVDEAARRGLAAPRLDLGGPGVAPLAESAVVRLAERIEQGRPYPLEALFVYYTNPVFSAPEPDRLAAALRRVPLLVSFSPFMDETTRQVDLVLPDHTYLERWQLDTGTPSVGFPLLGLRQPVVPPVHDTRSTGEVLIALARALGGSMARSFPDDELGMIKQLLRGVHQSGRGSVKAGTFDEFWKGLVAAGGWWDPPYRFGEWPRALATPSGKFEFYATRLEERLGADARRRWPELDPAAARDRLLEDLGVAARGDEAFLPHHEPVRYAAAEADYPFVLNSYKTMTHAEGRGANQPHLQELFGVQFDRSWGPWVEIHPADAAGLGIAEGDRVLLRSATGEARMRAVIHDGASRGVVNVPFEYGHTAYGRWAAGRGESVNLLGNRLADPLAGGVAWNDLRVQVHKA